MKVSIAAVGRLKDLERDLVARYVARFDAAGRSLALGPLKIVELSESRGASAAERKSDEAARLLKALHGCDALVVLDERGRSQASADFAGAIARRRDDGLDHLGFAIGGPDGHGDAVLSGATERLALGAMTLPHGLARILLAEQLYRAATIIAGHPYHRA